MDPRILHYYNRELQHIREMFAEFAAEYPKIAGRLGLEGLECADPYVERLLEGFGYMAARVQLKVDAEYPRFTQHLLEMVYPHYLAPIPSMALVQLQPDLTEGSLADGFTVPRGSVLRSRMGKDVQTACEYRTAHDVTLWPLEIAEASYHSSAAAVAALGIPNPGRAKAAIRWRLKSTAGLTVDKIALDDLALCLRGTDTLPAHVYEQLVANSVGIVIQPTKGKGASWRETLPKSRIRPLGFSEDEALLPTDSRSFDGYRHLQEYFAFPERFLFVELGGLNPGLRRCEAKEVDVIVLLDAVNPALEDGLNATHFALFCTPAANLLVKRADRIHLADKVTEFHVVPDRSRPLDFEVHSVISAVGHGTSSDQKQEFLPFYGATDQRDYREHRAYYVLHREQRRLSSRQREFGPRSSYVGSEVYISLVDGNEAPFSSDLRQLALVTLCTNRDLPLHMPVGGGKTDFTLESGAPVVAARCLAGPTRPRPSSAQREIAWRLISHMSLNFSTLADGQDGKGAAALRQLLSLYGDVNDPSTRKQIDGVVSISSRPVNRRVTGLGPIAFGRGLEVTLTMEEHAFEGRGVILLASVLERFLAKYASINSFTEMVLRTTERGEIRRWPTRIGQRHLL